MWVLPVREFLKMSGRPRCHQELMADRQLVRWRPGMLVVFVSHQWLSEGHPDPAGEQLAELRGALRGITEGSLDISTDMITELVFGNSHRMTPEERRAIHDGFLWYDYFGVPQPGAARGEADAARSRSVMARAVGSIPAYVQLSDYFVALAPPRRHSETDELCDTASWRQRGWCRMETICWALAPRATAGDVIVLRSASQVKFARACEWLHSPVGEGHFTDPQDRQALCPVLQRTVERKLEYYRALGDTGLFMYRLLLSLRPRLLAGLEVPDAERSPDAAHFLQKYSFRSWQERCAGGLGPLALAALEGNLEMLRHGLAAGADVNQRLADPVPELTLTGGESVVALTCRWGSLEAASCLIDAGADLTASNDFGNPVLIEPCLTSRPEMVSLLLDKQADVLHRNPKTGTTPLHLACLFGMSSKGLETARLLLEHNASANISDYFGATPLHCACISASAGPEVLRLLLAKGAEPNVRAVPSSMLGGAVLGAMRVLSWVGTESEMVRYLAESRGSTPLCIAALFGHSDYVRVLLAARANPDARNDRGHSVLDLASLGGHESLLGPQLVSREV